MQRRTGALTWCATLSVALCLLALAAPPAGALSSVHAGNPDASLRETVNNVPVQAAGASIVMTSFRPRGDGPFPWLVLSHGTATTAEANRKIGRYRPLGHGVFPSHTGIPLWTSAVAGFFKSQNLALPFSDAK